MVRSVVCTPSRGDEGVALILALVFVVLLAALVVDFSYEMQVEATFASSHDTDFEAYLAAKSAVAMGMGILAQDLILGEEEAAESGYNFYDSYDEPWAEGIPMEQLNENVMLRYRIEDEYGKLNLNALIVMDPEGNEAINEVLADALSVLFELRGLEEDPVDAILDWLDSDDDPLENGVENDYYSGLETPFTCKNGPMDSIEELLLIPGITPEVYFGDPELEQVSLDALLTVQGHPEGKINANTAPFSVLTAFLAAFGEADPEAVAEEMIVSREEEGPFSKRDDFREFGLIPQDKDKPGAPGSGEGKEGDEDADEEDGAGRVRTMAGAVDALDWSSSVFRIYGDGQSGDTLVRIVADVWRDTHGSGSDQMFRVIDWRIIR